jgi:hypothetical protein
MNKLTLYHYSDKDIKGSISPRYFGENCYTCNSMRISTVKRSYFYIDSQSQEPCFKASKFCYIAEIASDGLYDLRSNNLNLAEKLQGKDIFAEAKKRGFKGLIGNNGFNCICLFDAVKIKEKICRNIRL